MRCINAGCLFCNNRMLTTSGVCFQTILGDFSKEQEKFMQDKKDKEGRQEAAVPPWVGYNEEKAMKEQILALSTVSVLILIEKEM